MAGFNNKDFLSKVESIAVIASQTKQAVVNKFRISELDSKEIRVQITSSSVTVTNAITAGLETSYDGGLTWTSVDTQAIAGNGDVSMTFSYVAGTNNALGATGRVVITTGVGDVVTIDKIWITQRT